MTVFFIRSYTAWAVVALPLPDIVSDLTLTSSLTYTVDGRMTVWAGATLTIPAGTHIVLTPGSQIIVNGSVIANGTSKNHIVLSEGDIPPFIPFAQVVPTEVPALDDTSVETPEVQSPEIQPITIDSSTTESPEVQSPSVEPIITNTMMMGIDSVQNDKHFGFAFREGSSGTLSYTDIEDAGQGITVDHGSAVTISHGTFKNCSTGILGAGDGSLKLTSSAFDTVQVPVDWNFHGTFTHSNTSFINTELKGWRYGGDMMPGEKMNLNSTDGEYEIPLVTAQSGNDIEVGAGVTIRMNDGEPLTIAGGSLEMNGTADKPVTVYGDGNCSVHMPVIAITVHGTTTIKHTLFHDLCSGIEGSQATITLLDTDATTIAGPFLQATDYSTITADTVVLNDVYQGFDVKSISNMKINHVKVSVVNGDDAAVAVSTQVALTMQDSSIDNAKNCLNVSGNSSVTADTVTLDNCSEVALESNNDNLALRPSGIIVTNSSFYNSGTAVSLVKAVVTTFSNNTFRSNSVGVSLSDMGKTVIAHNDWGSPLGPKIESNPEGDGDSIMATNVSEVVYRPWIGMVIPSEYNPIIIVPGITGSVLRKNYDDKSEIWPNLTQLVLSVSDNFLDDLELLESGKQSSTRPMKVGDIIRNVKTADIFKSLIAMLGNNGYVEGQNLFVLPYDWRLSNTVNQSLLKGAIKDALAKNPDKTKVNIIAHSMGGLLVSDYIAQNPNAPIDHLFNIAVPHLGAPKAFKTLMYGDDMGFDFSIGPIKIPVLNSERTKIISQNMPSVYELLPSKKYVDTIGSYITDLSQGSAGLDSTAVQKMMIAEGRNEKMFSFADKLHQKTDNLKPSNISVYNFAGCGAEKTIAGYLITKEQSLSIAGLQIVPEYRLSYTDGDGVVPVKSASASEGAVNLYAKGGSHGTMPSLPSIQNAIVNVLDGKPIVQDKASGFGDCNTLPGEIVEVHSPVTLDIYDDQNRHTGPTDDGQIEDGIPGVQYDAIGQEKFAFLPAGPKYKIVNHAQSVGTYDLYVTQMDNYSNLARSEYFHAVPLDTAKAVGTFTVNASGGNYHILMDGDGDGQVDQSISPSSVLSVNQIKDSTPPTTYFKIVGDTMALSAADDTAGILNTKYSTDGKKWNIYTQPFTVAPGMTVYFVSLDNAGNTEVIRQTVVQGDASGSGTVVDTPSQDTATQTAAVAPVQPSSAASGSVSEGGGMNISQQIKPVVSKLLSDALQYAEHDNAIANTVHTIADVVQRVSPNTSLVGITSAASKAPESDVKTSEQQSLLAQMFPQDLLADAVGAVKTANKPLIVFTLGVLLITAVMVLIKKGK